MKKPNPYLLIGYALLVIVTTLTYLPALNQATIYRDDWYYTLDRLKGGPETFPIMFEIDRPIRGYFFEAYYRLFGVNPTPYHFVGFGLRVLAGLTAFWLFRLLWPEHIEASLVMSLLFVIYPGYTRWMEGFEDQPKIFSLCFQIISIILSLKAIEASGSFRKILFWTGSILTGLGYILLIDYAIGMEIFRFLCIYLFTDRKQSYLPFFKKVLATVRSWIPAALIPGIFLFWRLFIFHNQRPATDIGLQLSVILQSPIRGGWTWFLSLFRSIINQSVLAWWSPYFQNFFTQSNRSIFIGLLLAVSASALMAAVLLGLYKLAGRNEPLKYAIWIGLIGTIAGLLPIIAANRLVLFGAFSHYALPASLATATLVGGVVYSFSSRYVRAGFIAVLVLLAVVNHASVSANVLNEEQVIANFWHQVAWRAPNIRPGTTLSVSYPTVNYGEDVDAVFGPANFIYYPEPAGTLPVNYPLFATKQYFWTAKEILTGIKKELSYRTHTSVVDPDNILVISQSTKNACVHIINPRYTWFSYNDPDFIFIIGSYSRIDNVRTDTPSPDLDSTIFGPEPAHKWCYFFEKSELAAQNQDWNTVLDLIKEVDNQELHPNEQLEWMPFFQAYAVSGNEEGFLKTMSNITAVSANNNISLVEARNISEYNRHQACYVLKSMQKAGQEFSTKMQDLINATICGR